MLVLSRKVNESVNIILDLPTLRKLEARVREEGTVILTASVLDVHGNRAKLGFEGPREVTFLRDDAETKFADCPHLSAS